MAITPLDIRKKTFSTQLRGCSPSEVKAFLALVANEMEELRKERSLLAEKVDEVAVRLEGYEKTEKLIQETLLTAQRATEELREAARRESEAIITEARTRAQQIVLDNEQKVESAREELRRLETRRANMIDQIRGIAHSYLSMVDRHDRPETGHETADRVEPASDSQ